MAVTNDSALILVNPPIVEAVLDFDCDLPPSLDFESMRDAVRSAYGDKYPKFKLSFIQQARIEAKSDAAPEMSVRRGIHAFQCFDEAEKQLVQVRAQGYSFNRLAPYTSLDDYLPEIQQTWNLFSKLMSPVQVRVIRLRYINRILVPLRNGQVDLRRYFKGSSRSADGKLLMTSFLNQYAAVEKDTGNEVNVVVTSQPPENDRLPIIFDNGAACAAKLPPEEWNSIIAKIRSLRDLKNRVFKNTLTKKCLNLFQH
jgi:uncharacterized protein (TIGR04255 family)